MDNELFELCKEVYNRTQWEGEGVWGTLPQDFGKDSQARVYTSDYLLEKLPKKNIMLSFDEISGTWRTIYCADIFSTDRFRGNADTPLKSLLKLTKALHDAGELK